MIMTIEHDHDKHDVLFMFDAVSVEITVTMAVMPH